MPYPKGRFDKKTKATQLIVHRISTAGKGLRSLEYRKSLDHIAIIHCMMLSLTLSPSAHSGTFPSPRRGFSTGRELDDEHRFLKLDDEYIFCIFCPYNFINTFLIV